MKTGRAFGTVVLGTVAAGCAYGASWSGALFDSAGHPLAQYPIALRTPLQSTFTVSTDAGGKFSFPGLPGGAYLAFLTTVDWMARISEIEQDLKVEVGGADVSG